MIKFSKLNKEMFGNLSLFVTNLIYFLFIFPLTNDLAVQYRLTHTTGTGKWDGGTHSGDLFFTLIGKLGVTGSHECPADRGFGKTASCTFEDEANIGGLVKMKIENINGNNWAFTKLFVAVDGEVKAARTSYTWINRYKNTTFRLANISKYL